MNFKTDTSSGASKFDIPKNRLPDVDLQKVMSFGAGRDLSPINVASQGGERDSSLIAKRNNGRAAYDSNNQSNRLNFLETRKVD